MLGRRPRPSLLPPWRLPGSPQQTCVLTSSQHPVSEAGADTPPRRAPGSPEPGQLAQEQDPLGGPGHTDTPGRRVPARTFIRTGSLSARDDGRADGTGWGSQMGTGVQAGGLHHVQGGAVHCGGRAHSRGHILRPSSVLEGNRLDPQVLIQSRLSCKTPRAREQRHGPGSAVVS